MALIYDVAANLNKVVEKFGSNYKTANDGAHVRYCCPFCDRRRGKADKDYKLYVNYQKLAFKCFKCGAKGWLTKRFKPSSDSVYAYVVATVDNKINTEIEEESNMFYLSTLPITKNSSAYKYLESRGISEELIKYYDMRLGTDELFGRIVIPNEVYGLEKNWTDMYSARSYISQEPKYLNPDGAHKTDSVFNLHRQKRGDNIYVVEGALTSICAGKNSVCTYGSSPSEEQLTKIVNMDFKEITCAYDNDPSGQRGNEELAEKLNKMKHAGTEIYIVQMPEGIDAADMGEAKFQEYVAKNRVRYYSDVYAKIMTLFKEN